MYVILGDNQFLGINHSSVSKADEYARRFRDERSISDFLMKAADVGVERFCYTVSEKYLTVFNDLDRHGYLKYFSLNPSLPYAHDIAAYLADRGLCAYLAKVVGKGILPSVREIIRNRSLTKAFFAAFYSYYEDFFDIGRTEAIFLQNIFFDLGLGLNLSGEMIQALQQYGKRIGVFSYNPVLAEEVLSSFEDGEVVLATSLNVAGYKVNPSLAEASRIAHKMKKNFWGMNVLGSGIVDPHKMLAGTLFHTGNGILIGSSKIENIKQMRDVVETFGR